MAKPQAWLGVAISNTAVTLVEICHHKGHTQLLGYAIKTLPPGEVIDNQIVDCEQMGDHIAHLVQRIGSQSKQAAIALPTSLALTKIIEMPAELTEDEIEAQIHIDADQHIPYPLSQVCLDFQIQGPADTDDSMQQVLLVAARLEHVEQQADSLTFAQLQPKVVDLESHAQICAFQLAWDNLSVHKPNNFTPNNLAPNHSFAPANTPQTVALIDIGESRTTFYSHQSGQLVYQSQQLFGGAQLTQAIANQQGIDLSQAVIIKHDLAAYITCHQQQGSGRHKHSHKHADLTKVYTQFVADLAEHITQAFDAYAALAPAVVTEHIMLCGGSALLPDIEAMLKDQLSCDVSVANPFGQMKVSDKVDRDELYAEAPRLMSACGLALRCQMQNQAYL